MDDKLTQSSRTLVTAHIDRTVASLSHSQVVVQTLEDEIPPLPPSPPHTHTHTHTHTVVVAPVSAVPNQQSADVLEL